MAIINPTLSATAAQTYTPSDAALASAEEMAEPVTVRDYPRMYKLLVLANSVAWLAYFMGYIK